MGISSANEPMFAGLARKHCVETFGEDRALVLSQQALVEQYGGLIPPNGSQRHTPRDVFFRLVKEQSSQTERNQIWSYTFRKKAKGTQPAEPHTTE
jgi:hypothetical protein